MTTQSERLNIDWGIAYTSKSRMQTESCTSYCNNII